MSQPANGSVDLDTDPQFSHIVGPSSIAGALLVAAGENRTNAPAWTIPLFSTRGTRIDCFMSGSFRAARSHMALASPAQGIFIAAACDASGAILTARWNQVAWTPFLAA